ncbi:hypothetical protein N665_0372s0001 [Sinapis alba]|nr:hypothetical protein N665_0372s0001 [Sinapis alba]
MIVDQNDIKRCWSVPERVGQPFSQEQLHGNDADIFCNVGLASLGIPAILSSSSSSLSYSLMVSSLTDMPLTPYPLESSLLSTLAPSSSSDENAQSFTLRAPLNSKPQHKWSL